MIILCYSEEERNRESLRRPKRTYLMNLMSSTLADRPRACLHIAMVWISNCAQRNDAQRDASVIHVSRAEQFDDCCSQRKALYPKRGKIII
jgi:hypothetical protein